MRIMETFHAGCTFDHVIDASGRCVIPGLVDAHTHPVWEGDRVHEFAMKVGSFQQGMASLISQLKKI